MAFAPTLRTLALLLSLLAPLPGLAQGDAQPWHRAGAFVADAPLQPVDRLTAQCPAAPKEVCAYGRALGERCDVAQVKELGVHGASQYLLVQYLRATTVDGGEGREPFTCAADELVLVALPGGGQARIVWRDATEREYVFISRARLYSTAAGKRILAILYCLNGTGGCAQGMLIWTGEDWRKLERDDSWDAVYRNLPAGYRPHKSPAIDLGTLTWEQHLAHETDPNCCPSGKILFELAIVDDRLAVKSHEIVVPEPR